jgi:hypothetical protein
VHRGADLISQLGVEAGEVALRGHPLDYERKYLADFVERDLHGTRRDQGLKPGVSLAARLVIGSLGV